MTATVPPATANSVMSAYPAGAGNHLVLVATGSYPESSILQNLTYEFTGTNWVLQNSANVNVLDPAGMLPTRQNGVIGYDGTNLVNFGGQTAGTIQGVLEETWIWSHAGGWIKQSPATVPTGRFEAAGTYLSGVGFLMHGGQTSGGLLGDTQVWNGSNWSSVTSTVTPGYRSNHCMAANSSTAIMFGGKGNYNVSQDTFSYTSGGGWTKLAPAVSPSARYNAAMCYDSTASLFVLVGGQNQSGLCSDFLWTFNPTGNVWSQIVLANGVGPGCLTSAQVAYDSVSGKTIIFGGISPETNTASSNTWALTTASGTIVQL